jgi:hypothetical protein
MGEFCETTIVPETGAPGLRRFSDQANPPKRPTSIVQPLARLGFPLQPAGHYNALTAADL